MIIIIDYGVGNLGSLSNMLRKLGVEARVAGDADAIRTADKLILPGVGAFDTGMRHLQERELVPHLEDAVLERGRPILGICLGMQLLARGSQEGRFPGLGWLDANVERFNPSTSSPPLKVPHMGWNTAQVAQAHPLFAGLEKEARFYFVHSYHMVAGRADAVLAWTEYGRPFVSGVAFGNIMGVQFHPEKSHRYGMRLLRNFAEMD